MISSCCLFSTDVYVWHGPIVWLLGKESRDQLAPTSMIRLLIDVITIVRSCNSILIMVSETTKELWPKGPGWNRVKDNWIIKITHQNQFSNGRTVLGTPVLGTPGRKLARKRSSAYADNAKLQFLRCQSEHRVSLASLTHQPRTFSRSKVPSWKFPTARILSYFCQNLISAQLFHRFVSIQPQFHCTTSIKAVFKNCCWQRALWIFLPPTRHFL